MCCAGRRTSACGTHGTAGSDPAEEEAGGRRGAGAVRVGELCVGAERSAWSPGSWSYAIPLGQAPKPSLKPVSPGTPQRQVAKHSYRFQPGADTRGRVGTLPAVLESSSCWLSGRGQLAAAGKGGLRPPPADTHAKAPPSLGHMSTKVGPEWAPSELCVSGSWASAVHDPELQSHHPNPVPTRVCRAWGVSTAVPRRPGTPGGPAWERGQDSLPQGGNHRLQLLLDFPMIDMGRAPLS